MKLFKYLFYLSKHKWMVMIECFKYGLYWRGIMHDMSKFLPDEFIPYMNYYFGGHKNQNKRFKNNIDFEDRTYNIASLKHEHRNKHHWQYWVRISTSAGREPIEMPKKYMLELVCDWRAAAKIQGNILTEWYEKNKSQIEFNPATRKEVELLIK